jgi:phosphotransferase system enzyme I (PtsI)
MQTDSVEDSLNSLKRNAIQVDGKCISPGIAIGKALLLENDLQVPKISIPHERVEEEKSRYEQAVDLLSRGLHEQAQVVHGGYIFNAHQLLRIHELLLADGEFHKKVKEGIEVHGRNAEWALYEASLDVINLLERSRDSVFEARAEDVRDLASNLLLALLRPRELSDRLTRKVDRNQILFSKRLYLSEVMMAADQHVRGFVTESSAFSSHAAILLKSFGIPSLGGVRNIVQLVRNGDRVIVDSFKGKLILNPTSDLVSKHQNLKLKIERQTGKRSYVPLEAFTRDGTRVHLMANVNNLRQMDMVIKNRMEGVGLFRTEFFVLSDNKIPSEDEQYSVYRSVIKALKGRPIVIRTFDIGGDKLLPDNSLRQIRNPALGIRGIRRQLLVHPQELVVQIRAILRAAVDSNVGILLPMVTITEELKKVRKLLAQAQDQLREEGLPFSSNVNLGAMIEVPAAAFSIKDILSEVDFVSIGTNDLIQYFTAADRDSEIVLHYSSLKNKSVQGMLDFIITQAKEANRQQDVTICGEIASDPINIELLLRIGYRSLSISPVFAPSIRRAIRATRLR